MAWMYAYDPDTMEILYHKGDSGAMSLALRFDNNEVVQDGHLPKVGCCMKVGSMTARSFQRQDYWLTTPIEEILEDSVDQETGYKVMRFRTRNSYYLWKE